jgi:hypothetical protein
MRMRMSAVKIQLQLSTSGWARLNRSNRPACKQTPHIPGHRKDIRTHIAKYGNESRASDFTFFLRAHDMLSVTNRPL